MTRLFGAPSSSELALDSASAARTLSPLRTTHQISSTEPPSISFSSVPPQPISMSSGCAPKTSTFAGGVSAAPISSGIIRRGRRLRRVVLDRPGVPELPRGVAVLVQPLEPLLVLERVHRRPEAMVLLREHLALRHQTMERLLDHVLAGPDLVEQLRPHDEVAAVDPDVGLGHVAQLADGAAVVHRENVEAVVRMDREEAGRRPGRLGALDHRRQVSVGERVAVVRQEQLVVAQQVSHRAQPLADLRLQPGVDEGDIPVVDVRLQQMDARPPSESTKSFASASL